MKLTSLLLTTKAQRLSQRTQNIFDEVKPCDLCVKIKSLFQNISILQRCDSHIFFETTDKMTLV